MIPNSQITKQKTPRNIKNRDVFIKCQRQNLNDTKQIENNFHIPDLVHAVPDVENG